MTLKQLFLNISLILVFSTCVKPYYPEISKYEHVLVIDGTLTDDGTPPIVNISYSTNVNSSNVEKVAGANVYILTSNGQKYNLTENGQGIYTYTQAMFPVTVGVLYQLVVEYDGHVFKSTMEKILSSSAITDISFQVKTDSKGVDLYISSEESDSASRYYLWKLTETWKFRSPIYSYKKSVNKEYCYATSIDGFRLGTTENYSQNRFKNYPLLYIPISSPKLYYRYSILVEQYSISRSTYVYLNHVKNVNEAGGSLFDPIPANMNGNITSETAPVIGNFQVSSLKSKRIYIDRSDLPQYLNISSGMEDCKMEMISLDGSQTKIRDSLEKRMIVMDSVVDIIGSFVRFTNAIRCYDCTATGSPNTPPVWWQEKK